MQCAWRLLLLLLLLFSFAGGQELMLSSHSVRRAAWCSCAFSFRILGLMQAERLSSAAYWTTWADAVFALQQRCTEAFARCLQGFRFGKQAAAPSLQVAAAACKQVGGDGWTQRPDSEACLQSAASQAARGQPDAWANMGE